MWDPTFFLISRSNFAGLPVVPELLKACKKLYSADFYGYVNSDILIAPSLFYALDFILKKYRQKRLTDGVSPFPHFWNVVLGVFCGIQHREARSAHQLSQRVLGLHRSNHCAAKFPRALQFGRENRDFLWTGLLDFPQQRELRRVSAGGGGTWHGGYVSDVACERMKISMVDVKYAVMMLHQGFDNYLQKASRNKYSPQDVNYNYAIWSGLDMKKVCMSIPGDQVMCRKWIESTHRIDWKRSRLVMEPWSTNEARREKKREKLIALFKNGMVQRPRNAIWGIELFVLQISWVWTGVWKIESTLSVKR